MEYDNRRDFLGLSRPQYTRIGKRGKYKADFMARNSSSHCVKRRE